MKWDGNKRLSVGRYIKRENCFVSFLIFVPLEKEKKLIKKYINI